MVACRHAVYLVPLPRILSPNDQEALTEYPRSKDTISLEEGKELRTTSGKEHLVWTIHHSVYDGWSLALVLQRVQQIYQKGRSDLSQTPYTRFIKYLLDININTTREYWKASLAGVPTYHFPKQSRYALIEVPNGDTIAHPLELPSQRHNDITQANIARAAWAMLLSAYTGSDDVVFGETFTGRDISVAGIADIYGPTLTTVPTRIQINRDATVSDFLGRISIDVTDRIPHQHCGLSDIKRIDDNLAAACDFQNLLVIQTANKETPDSIWSIYDNGAQSNFFTYPLVIECTMRQANIEVLAHYHTNIISTVEVQRLFLFGQVPLGDGCDPGNSHCRCWILTECKSTLLVCLSHYESQFSKLVSKVICINEALIGQMPPLKVEVPLQIKGNNICYVIFMSGSTGMPKGVVVEHRAIASSSAAICRALHISPSSRVFQFCSFAFDVSIGETLAVLICGATIFIPSEEQRTTDVASAISSLKADWASRTRTVADLIDDASTVPTLKTLVTGGEVMTQEVVDKFASALQLCKGYGPTEGTVFAITNDQVSIQRDPTNIGRATEVYAPDGSIKYLGRGDNQIKVAGPRVEPGEIEHRLKIDNTIQSAVMTKHATSAGQRWDTPLVGSDVTSQLDRVKRKLSDQLPSYMVPSVWVAVPCIPLLASAKVDRKLIETWLERMDNGTYQDIAAVESSEGATVPATKTAAILQRTWANVVGVGVNDVKTNRSWLSLGGDSITAMRLLAKCRAEGIHLTLNQVLCARSLVHLANDIEPYRDLDPGSESNRRILRPFSDATCHSMLRARFCRTNDGQWRQLIPRDDANAYALNVHNIAYPTEAVEFASATQQSLCIRDGPVSAVDIFTLRTGEQLAFIAAHHLGIDSILRTDVVDLLVAAILHSFSCVFFKQQPPTVFNESHGREPWASSHIDLSRTVGWFTTLFPISVDINEDENHVVHTVCQVKDLCRRITDNRRPYFAHQFTVEDDKESLEKHTTTEVLFNYLGKTQQHGPSDSFFKSVSLGEEEDTKISDIVTQTTCLALFEITASVVDGHIQMSFMYNRWMKNRKDIRRWIAECERTIEDIVSSIMVIRTPQPTMADFPLLPLDSYSRLDRVLKTLPLAGVYSYEQVEEFPCSTTQEGVLLSQIKDPASYWTFTTFEVNSTHGHVNQERLAEAWAKVVRRHQALRTIIIDSVCKGGVFDQIVLKSLSTGLVSYRCEDSELTATLDSINYHNLNGKLKSRLPHQAALLETSLGRVIVKIFVSHAVVDGASLAIIGHDLQEAYKDRLSSEKGPLYSDYIRCVGNLLRLSYFRTEHSHRWHRRCGSEALFNTVVSVQNSGAARSSEHADKNIQFEQLDGHDPSEFAITVNIDTTRADEVVRFTYWTDAVSDNEAKKFSSLMAKILAQVLAHANQTIMQLDLTRTKIVSASAASPLSTMLSIPESQSRDETSRSIPSQPVPWTMTSEIPTSVPTGNSDWTNLIRSIANEIVPQIVDQVLRKCQPGPESAGSRIYQTTKLMTEITSRRASMSHRSQAACGARSRRMSITSKAESKIQTAVDLMAVASVMADGALYSSDVIEKKLLKLWSELLDMVEETTEKDDSFFVGTPSKISREKTNLVGAAREEGLLITVADAFKHPTFTDIPCLCTDRAGSLFVPPHQLSHLHKSLVMRPARVVTPWGAKPGS
ncbi:hypothetical protein EJ07DRAFT_150123 [Lizonia empirigonia]|nr:hypothetical protein EJ07DRAFT_150123 [Lizonia empirigonia]